MAGSVWAVPTLRFIKYDLLLGPVLIHQRPCLCSYLPLFLSPASLFIVESKREKPPL